MSSGALAVGGMTRLPGCLECVGLKGLRACVTPCCRQSAGLHTHAPYSYATSLKLPGSDVRAQRTGVRKWVIRAWEICIYTCTFFLFSFSLIPSIPPAHCLAHSPSRPLPVLFPRRLGTPPRPPIPYFSYSISPEPLFRSPVTDTRIYQWMMVGTGDKLYIRLDE